MTSKIADRVFETSTTTGTGTMTLAGAVQGFQGFSVIGTTIKTPYYIDDADSTGIAQNWETGIGTVIVSGGITTVSRDTILASSNANVVVNFGTGTKNVRGGIPAAMFPVVDENLNNVRHQAINTTGSTANTIAIALAYTPLAYSDGLLICFRVPLINTTAGVTVNVNGKGAIALKYNGVDPGISALTANSTIWAIYNSATTTFDILNTTPGLAAAAQVNAVAAVDQLFNVTATVASNALTVSLAPCNISFRSTTLNSGTPVKRTVPSTISLVVPNTATIGTVSGVASRLYIIALDNAGTVELAILNPATGFAITETGLYGTNSIAPGSNSTNLAYSTTARSSLAYRIVGFIDITEVTAGTWATAPTLVQGAPATGISLNPVNAIPAGIKQSGATAMSGLTGVTIGGSNIAVNPKRISVDMYLGSNNGSSGTLIQLGTAAGLVTTGYVTFSYNGNSSLGNNTNTTGLLLQSNNSGLVNLTGVLILECIDPTNYEWVGSGILLVQSVYFVYWNCRVVLPGPLTQVRIQSGNNSDIFPAGSKLAVMSE